jgi:hypothetical protein
VIFSRSASALFATSAVNCIGSAFAVNSPVGSNKSSISEAMPKKFKGTPAQERALNAYVKLERAASAAFAYARVGLEEAGLTLSQFAVLEALYHVGPQCLGDLARRILTSSGNLTLVIDNLQKRGKVEGRRAGAAGAIVQETGKRRVKNRRNRA